MSPILFCEFNFPNAIKGRREGVQLGFCGKAFGRDNVRVICVKHASLVNGKLYCKVENVAHRILIKRCAFSLIVGFACRVDKLA